MDKYIAGGLIGGAGSFLGSGLNALSNYFTNQQNIQMAREQRAWQRAENQRAFQRDLMMWDLNNQYNSPQAQRERIEAAGGNAMLAFGNGVNVTSGNSSSYPTLDPAKSLMPELNAYTGWNLGMSDIGQAIQREKLFHAEIGVQEASAQLTQAKTLGQIIDNTSAPELKSLAIEQQREIINGIKKDNMLKQQNYDINDEHRALNLALKSLELDIKDLNLRSGEFDLKYKEDVRHLRVAAESLNNTLKQSQVDLNKEQQAKIIAETAKIKQDTSWDQYWNSVKEVLGPNNKDGLVPLFKDIFYNAFKAIESFGVDIFSYK